MILYDIFYSTLANKCPRCHKGDIFVSGNSYNLKLFSRMHEKCSYCGLEYEREPGFFYGAMYVSYGLMSGIFIVLFVADSLWFHLPTPVLLSLVVGSMLILFPVAFRWARIIWLNFFVRYDKEIQKEECDENHKV